MQIKRMEFHFSNRHLHLRITLIKFVHLWKLIAMRKRGEKVNCDGKSCVNNSQSFARRKREHEEALKENQKRSRKKRKEKKYVE